MNLFKDMKSFLQVSSMSLIIEFYNQLRQMKYKILNLDENA